MLIPAAVLSVTLAGVFSETFQDWLLSDESGSTTIRNLGLVLAGLIALPLAIWRGLVAQRQASAAQQSLRNERYQKGAEMLGSQFLSVRLAGIYALQRLAGESPEDYHVQIMNVLCAFARNPTKDAEHEAMVRAKTGNPSIREDVQAGMQVIGKRTRREVALEQKVGTFSDLGHANLRMGLLIKANLINTQFWKADLSGTWLQGANLTNAHFYQANLENAALDEANLSSARFSGTDVAEIRPDADSRELDVRGLTQRQLDQARADPDNPPDIRGVLDAETGQPLAWRGGRGAPLKDES